MQSEGWTTLLQSIPAAQHGNLMLVTTAAIEISIQGILEICEEHLFLKGRLAGTDQARFLFMPYSQINYLGFQKMAKEAEVRTMFGLPPLEGKAAASVEAPAPEAAEAVTPIIKVPEAPAAPAEAPAAPKPVPEPMPAKRPLSPLDKKGMLERLRARVATAAVRAVAPGSQAGA